MTSIVNLDIPIIIQGTKQSVEYFPKVMELGDSYQQVTGSSEHQTTWTLVSAFTEYETIEEWTNFLDSFDGATEFLIFLSDEIGSVVVYCDSYNLIYSTHEKGQLSMECTESNNSEYSQLIDYLITETIPDTLMKAYDFMNRFSGSASIGGYQYFGYPDKLPNIWVHPNENQHTGSLSANLTLQVNGGQQAIPDVCGTTETAFLNILALCETALVLNEPFLKSSARGIAQAIILGFAYRGQGGLVDTAVPNPANASTFLPHWLYAVRASAPIKKYPTTSPKFLDGTSLDQNETQGIGLWESVTFTQLGLSNVWYTTLTNNLDCVYRVIGYSSNLAGQTETKNPLTKVINGTELGISHWVDKNNKHCFYYNLQMLERGTNFITGNNPGLLFVTVPSGYNFSGNARVIYTVFDSPSVPVGLGVINTPFWRRANNSEYVVDLSSIKYVYQAYDALSSEPAFARARDATKISFEKIVTLLNGTNIFNDPDQTNVFDISGINLVHIGGRNGYLNKIDSTRLRVTQSEDTTNSSSLVVQQSYNRILWDTNTIFTTSLSSNLDAIFYSQFIELKFDTENNDAIKVYKIAIPIPYAGSIATISITHKDLLNWGEGCNWYATYRNDPIFNYGGGNGYLNLFYEKQVIIDSSGQTSNPIVLRAVFHNFNNPIVQDGQIFFTPRKLWGNNPPRINYKLKNGRMRLRIFDSLINEFSLILQPDDSWKVGVYEWDDLVPLVAGTIPVPPISYVGINTYVDQDAELSVYWMGEAPTPMPIPTVTKRTYFENKIRFAHQWFIGTSQVINNAYDTIAFTPGIVPFSVTLDGDKKPKFGGQIHSGFQSYRLWQMWNKPFNAALVLDFLKQASESFQNNSPIKQTGLFRPLYSLQLWDLLPQDIGYRFYEVYSQPFPEWTIAPEPISSIWTLKLVADLAEAWRNDPTNADLERLVINFISAINDYWRTNGNPGKVPSIIQNVESTNPMLRPNEIFFPEGSALLMMIAIDANIVGRNRLLTFKTIDDCYKYLRGEEQKVGLQQGSWTFNAQDTIVNGTTYKKYRTDQHAWLMRSYAKLYRDKGNLRYPTFQEWTSSNS